MISHGNGPQVGLLALQGSAYTAVETYPLDVLGAQTEGMIGYIIQQELGNELPFERPLATLLTMIEVDADDPAFGDPTKPIGPVYDAEEAARLEAEKGWAFKPDGDSMRRVVPSPQPKRIFEIEAIKSLLEKGCVVICAGGGGIPTMLHGRARARRAPARRRRGGDRQGPRERPAREATRGATCSPSSPTSTPSTPTGERRSSARSGTRRRPSSRPTEFAEGSMGPKVRAACQFVERDGEAAR